MDKRITELEKKAAFQERLLQELNDALVGQRKEIEALKRQVSALKDQAAGKGAEGLVKDLDEEDLPPHY